MHKIVKQLTFCYGHRLLEYQGKCARPHGHTALVEIELASSQLNALGMVRDFGEVKDILGRYIEDTFDHRMILRQDDPLVKALRDLGEEVVVLPVNPTAEHLARILFEQARKLDLPVSAVRLWETQDSYAEYGLQGCELEQEKE
ncbi:MAG TPA: 6-carboxytetrahydropterin synthase [Acidobacteriota bacterium]|nr:6-carboxytetrahydropterin synthase [Acidobacteriota bacterium]